MNIYGNVRELESFRTGVQDYDISASDFQVRTFRALGSQQFDSHFPSLFRALKYEIIFFVEVLSPYLHGAESFLRI
jgi:hypothetical protein